MEAPPPPCVARVTDASDRSFPLGDEECKNAGRRADAPGHICESASISYSGRDNVCRLGG